MRIRIDENFDNEVEAEYRKVDDESIVGNGKLSNLNVKIVDVSATDVKNEEEKYKEYKCDASIKDRKYNVNISADKRENSKDSGFTVDIQGATIIDGVYEKKVIKKYNNSNDNLDIKEKTERKNDNTAKVIDKSEQRRKQEYNKEKIIKGKISVCSKLGDINGTLISDAKINLYALNGISPKLVDSKITNKDGIVVFDNLPEGSYRVIAIVNRKYFEKPTYIQWNEVTINKDLEEESIIVINRIKKY